MAAARAQGLRRPPGPVPSWRARPCRRGARASMPARGWSRSAASSRRPAIAPTSLRSAPWRARSGRSCSWTAPRWWERSRWPRHSGTWTCWRRRTTSSCSTPAGGWATASCPGPRRSGSPRSTPVGARAQTRSAASTARPWSCRRRHPGSTAPSAGWRPSATGRRSASSTSSAPTPSTAGTATSRSCCGAPSPVWAGSRSPCPRRTGAPSSGFRSATSNRPGSSTPCPSSESSPRRATAPSASRSTSTTTRTTSTSSSRSCGHWGGHPRARFD